MTRRSRTWAGVALVAILVSGAGCGWSGTAVGPSAGPSTVEPPLAVSVLNSFDRADSVASTAGDIAALRAQETGPALDASVAAVHRAEAQGSPQPTFAHTDPVFAVPAGQPSCFLAVATLRLTGEELTRVDLSQFVRDPSGSWKLSHHVLVAPDSVPAVRAIGGSTATPAGTAIDASRRDAIARQVFGRTVGGTRDETVVAPNITLDGQLAAGWGIYTQQLHAGGMVATRSLDSTEWSVCAATSREGTVAFLTLHVTDSVTPAAGGPPMASLPPQTPDLIATGHTTTVRGRTVTVTRVESFALLLPSQGPAAVLGVSDAPIAVSAGA